MVARFSKCTYLVQNLRRFASILMVSTDWLYKLATRPVPPRSKRKLPVARNESRNDNLLLEEGDIQGAEEWDKPTDTLSNVEALEGGELDPYVLNKSANKNTTDNSTLANSIRISKGFRTDLATQSTILAILLALVMGWITYRKRQRRSRHRKQYGDNVFPPLAPLGLFDSARVLAGIDLPRIFQRCANRVGPIFHLALPFCKSAMFVVVGNVEAAKEILQDSGTYKPEDRFSSIVSIAGDNNIMASEGVHWKVSRKGLTPAFMKANLDRFHRVCRDQTEQWIQERLETTIRNDESFDVGQECLFLTLSIFCRAAFEYVLKESEVQRLMKDLETISCECIVSLLQFPLKRLLGGVQSTEHAIDSAKGRIQSFARNMLRSYRKAQKNRRATMAVKDSIISCIDKNTEYEDDKNRIADIVMLLVSGYESTAFTLAWTLVELARHPTELKNLSDSLRGPDDSFAQQMLKDVLREAMRLRPATPGIGFRMTSKDFYLKSKRIVIPEGALLIFPSIILTRDEVEAPEEFRPSRWIDHPDRSFLSFSSGRRNCIGQSFGLTEVTWVLSRLCGTYEFEVVEEGSTTFLANMKCIGTRLKARHRP